MVGQLYMHLPKEKARSILRFSENRSTVHVYKLLFAVVQ